MYYHNFTFTDSDNNITYEIEVTGNTETHDFYVQLYDNEATLVDTTTFSRKPTEEDILNTFGFER